MAYREADVFLLCYKISEPSSLFNAVNHWCPEVRSVAPVTPIILVGCQADLRKDRDILTTLAKQGRAPVSADQALSFSQQVSALMYVETSARTSTRAAISAFEVAGLASMGQLTKPRSPRSTPSPKALNKKQRYSSSTSSPQNSLDRSNDLDIEVLSTNNEASSTIGLDSSAEHFWERLQSPKISRSTSEAHNHSANNSRMPSGSLHSSRSASLSSKSIPSISSSLGSKTPKASRKSSMSSGGGKNNPNAVEKTMTIKCQRLTQNRTYEEIEVEVPIPIYETIQLYNDTGSLAARSKERSRSLGTKLKNLFTRGTTTSSNSTD